MLRYAIAQEERDRLGIQYLLGDAARLQEQVEPNSFDLVTSCLALHATLEDWLHWLLAAGFSLWALREPVPSPEAVARHPELADCLRVPYFLLMRRRSWSIPRGLASRACYANKQQGRPTFF